MNINPQQLQELAALSDVDLWAKIVSIGESRGFQIPKQPPSHDDMLRLRALLTSGTAFRLTDAVRLVNEYKKKYGG